MHICVIWTFYFLSMNKQYLYKVIHTIWTKVFGRLTITPTLYSDTLIRSCSASCTLSTERLCVSLCPSFILQNIYEVQALMLDQKVWLAVFSSSSPKGARWGLRSLWTFVCALGHSHVGPSPNCWKHSIVQNVLVCWTLLQQDRGVQILLSIYCIYCR